MESNGLKPDEQYIQDNTALGLVTVLTDTHGTPVSLAVSAAGPILCRKLRDLLPKQTFSSLEANDIECGITGIVNGREECLMLIDLDRTLRNAKRTLEGSDNG
jgi:hypothetical protein